jgi:phage terminase large subunit
MNVEFPEKLQPLFEDARYTILYGGRGGAKSWGVARALLILGAANKLRIPCCREIQLSIRDSVIALLANQIEELGLSSFYEVQAKAIYGKNGTEFSFHGLRHNVSNIKSLEGADICWVEEAQNVSNSSWNTLIPTIRKPNSRIIVTFNPGLESDITYDRFVKNPPTGAKVIKINWSDNPWFPDVLKQELEDLKLRNYDDYLNVWEGHCKVALDGAVYKDELQRATLENRITKVPYDRLKPVNTAWDLGRSDMTSIWFYQVAGLGELRIIDYYENNKKDISHYLQELQSRGYVYGVHHMPHDAESEHLVADKTIAGQARAAGFKVNVIKKFPGAIATGINMVRTIFPNCYFDAEKCADGIQCLRHYHYDTDESTEKTSKEPVHDWSSHGADAFRYLAVGFKEPRKRKEQEKHNNYNNAGGWLGA